jgi:hypothetical protein
VGSGALPSGIGDGLRIPGHTLPIRTLDDNPARPRAATLGADREALRKEFLD